MSLPPAASVNFRILGTFQFVVVRTKFQDSVRKSNYLIIITLAEDPVGKLYRLLMDMVVY
jgi:hypothetical protein